MSKRDHRDHRGGGGYDEERRPRFEGDGRYSYPPRGHGSGYGPPRARPPHMTRGEWARAREQAKREARRRAHQSGGGPSSGDDIVGWFAALVVGATLLSGAAAWAASEWPHWQEQITAWLSSLG